MARADQHLARTYEFTGENRFSQPSPPPLQVRRPAQAGGRLISFATLRKRVEKFGIQREMKIQ
jgi:hypothetical protein